MASLTQTIAADQQAVADAQAVLDAANAKLSADQAALAAVQPHLNALNNISAELVAVQQGTAPDVAAVLEGFRLQAQAIIDQMLAVFNAV